MSFLNLQRSTISLALCSVLGLAGCSDNAVNSDEGDSRWSGGEGSATLSEPLGAVAFSAGNSLTLDVGFGSGATHRAGDPANVFYTLTDRGPNVKCKDSEAVIGIAEFCGAGNSGDKIFPLPDYTPRIYKIKLNEDFTTEILDVIELKDANGQPISGLTNPLTATDTEQAFGPDGAQIAFDPNGLDTESIAALGDGSFWISDEYAPSLVHVAADGTIIERVVPASVAADLSDAGYPVRGLLPDVLKKRKLNRGIESVAVAPDESALYFMMQSPLANPDKAAYSNSRSVRLLKYALNADGSLGSLAGTYVYTLDTPQTFADLRDGSGDLKNGTFRKQSNVKVSEMVAVGTDDLIVLERISKITKLYRVDLSTGDRIDSTGGSVSDVAVANNESTTNKTLAQLYDPSSAGATPLMKSLVFNSLTDMPDGMSLPSKVEGIALLDDDYVLLINDNDFGIEGDPTVATVLKIGQRLRGDDTRSRRIELVQRGSYAAGILDASAAEINAYAQATQEVFVTNAATGKIDILDASDPASLNKVAELDLAGDINDPLLGSVNSVAVHGTLLAAAIERGDGLGNAKQGRGLVAFYDIETHALLKTVSVGYLPDMVTFTPDGTTLLVANEGEPNDAYDVDPEGSVSLIAIDNGTPADTAIEIGFSDFNSGGSRASELPAEVRIFGPGASVAQDLEPEYITVAEDSQRAWVALQENNALAEIDLAAARVTRIAALGYKDYGRAGNALDASDRDNVAGLDGTVLRNGRGKINIRTWGNVLGMYQPDSIASLRVDGIDYVLTANEGDARDYAGFSEEVRMSDMIANGHVLSAELAAYQAEEALGRLKITSVQGVNNGVLDTLYSYGARSFSVRDAAGNLLFDSGDDIARITAGRLGQDFNASNSKAPTSKKNDRSGAKGAEPEALAVGMVNNRRYVFIGLERVSGIMVYDISAPRSPQFVQYINNRDFSKDPTLEAAGDVAPEGMSFVRAEDSPSGKPLLIVSSEVSGTTTVYEIE